MKINWEKVNGLVPAIVQDANTKTVLMMGYMNEEALEKTQETGKITFFSRSKNRLWTKGETSQNFLNLKSVNVDCDNDTLLVMAEPDGPTCHLGTTTCWGEQPGNFLDELQQLVAKRDAERPKGSYTTKLFEEGIKRCAQKVGEEGVEVSLAATAGDEEELLNESADLLFHLIVLLQAKGTNLNAAIDKLSERNS